MKSMFLVLSILSIAGYVFAADVISEHPVAINGAQCESCHAASSTSENKSESSAHADWQMSLHGLNSVNCTTCHGDEKNFRPQAQISDCASCHFTQTETITRKTEASALVCLNCHKAHLFEVNQEKTLVHKK